MAGPALAQELAQEAATLRLSGLSIVECAERAGCAKSTMESRLKIAALRGLLLDHKPAMPGFRISQVSQLEREDKDGNVSHQTSIQQRPEHGDEPYKAPEGQILDKVSVLLNPERGEIIKWEKYRADAAVQAVQMRAVVDAFKSEIPRTDPVLPIPRANADLLNQYTVTDLHFGMLSWREETGSDYDLKIAEQLLLDWFAAAIRMSPNAETAILCQLGDLLHHDAHESVTPAHRNVLDADSRLQKMIRVVIRTMRRIARMLLEKHERVHFIMSDANHDPAGGAWLREMFAAFFEDEPRVTVDTSPSTYNVYEHGLTSLFYHHGHKRKISSVDSVFVGKFREIFGRTKFSYAHLGHLHSDEMKSMPTTMKVERHETLAGPDAYAANGGWLSGRSAKVITYSKRFGEVGRITLTPEMVQGEAA